MQECDLSDRRTTANDTETRLATLVDISARELAKAILEATFERMPDTTSCKERSTAPRDPLYSKESAAKYLDASPEYVRDLITRRKIKALKIGRMVRIRESELDRFIAEHES